MNLSQRRIAATAIRLGLTAAAAIVLLGLPRATGEEPGGAERVADAHGDPLPTGALDRLGTVRFRTGGRILCAAYSPDGKLLVTGNGDDPVRLWEAATGKELRQLKETWVYAVAFSRDGSTLATGGGFKTVRLWNVQTGQPLGPPLKGHQGPIKAVAFSPDGSLLATAGLDKTVRLWAVAGGQLLATFSGHQDEVNALAFNSEGKMLVSAGGDRTIRVWQVPSGQLLQKLDGGCALAALAFAADDRTLVSGGDDDLIHLWEVGTWQEARKLRGHKQSIVSLLFTPDGKTLVSGDLGDSIRLWDLASGRETGRIARQLGDADALALSPDGRVLAAGGTNNTVRRWDILGKELVVGAGHQAGIASMALAPDGKLLASGSNGGGVRFWVPGTSKEAPPRLGLGLADALVAYAPDGKTIAVADAANPVRLVGISTRKVQGNLAGPKDDPVLCMAFSPDGKLLGVGHRIHGIRLWKVAGGSVAHQLPYPGGVQALAFAPDSKTVAGAGTEKIILWETATGQKGLQIGKALPVACLAFAPDGQTLAAGMYDATVQLWDVRPGPDQGKELRSLEGHTSAVFALAFSSDGRMLASGSYDRSVRLWETASGQQIAAWAGHQGPVTATGFLPGGRVVTSGSADTSILLWDGTGRSGSGKLPPLKIAAGDMEGLWQELAAEDVPRAYRALWSLVAGAGDAVPLLETQKRVFLVDPEHIHKLLRDLNDNKFAVRERAHGELAKYGRWIEGVLDVARKNPPSEEVRRRVEKLLARLQVPGSLSLIQERLRARRLMEVLEQSDVPAARELLQKLASQAAEADLRAEAQASLARLEASAGR